MSQKWIPSLQLHAQFCFSHFSALGENANVFIISTTIELDSLHLFLLKFVAVLYLINLVFHKMCVFMRPVTEVMNGYVITICLPECFLLQIQLQLENEQTAGYNWQSGMYFWDRFDTRQGLIA